MIKDIRSITIIGCFLKILFLFPLAAFADEIYTAVGLSLPPYVIKETISGMELDIVREALAVKGHTIRPRFVSLKQVPVVFNKRVVDAAMTVTEDFNIMAFYSDVVITYQNYAITLAENNFSIQSLDDLKYKRIVAFQNARTYLGADFARAVDQAEYREVKRQLYQVHRLYLKRTDVVISDKNIFLYYKQKASAINTSKKVIFHPIFKPNHYKVAFRDPNIRNDFNAGLQHLKSSGRYDEILQVYVDDK